MKLDDLAKQIIQNGAGTKRYIVAIAGPPASGKTTLTRNLCDNINSQVNSSLCITVPMDGFHLSNEKLNQMDMRHVKGAPLTFDAKGFVELIQRIRLDNDAVAIPEFDRELDAVVFGDQSVDPDHRIIIVEGNFILLDEAPWDQLKAMFDLSVMLIPEEQTLEKRLISRWENYNHSEEEAKVRAFSNDIPNAKYVLANSMQADIKVTEIVDKKIVGS
jgi:pantothenate kinase